MNDQSLYKAVLLDHFHNPRNKGDLDAMQQVARGSNPRCGDEIEVGIDRSGDTLEAVRFRGRGCSICLASASMMTESARGLAVADARNLIDNMKTWFDDRADTPAPVEQLAALGPVKQHPARKKCVMLAWQALQETLDRSENPQRGEDS